MKPCNDHIRKTIKLTIEMIEISDNGESDREDTGCGILYSILRDCAYRIRKLAEDEKQAHIKKGWWNKKKDTV
jgi:hypothetical protein